jgi:hypothetical protein
VKAPVFLSYAREDSDFARRLAADLKAKGANVWLDQLDIQPGQPWDREVERALTMCNEMVILSPASVDSSNVMDEVAFALEERKRVIPVLHKECRLPFRLRRLQYIDLRSDYGKGLAALVITLPDQREVVHREPTNPVVERPPASSSRTFVKPAVPHPMAAGESQEQGNIHGRAVRREKSRFALWTLRLAPIAAVTVLAAGSFLFWRQSALTIRVFAVDRGRIQAGESVLLHWWVDKGRVTITPEIGETSLLEGFRHVTPSATVSYTLEAHNFFWSDRRTVAVSVLPPSPSKATKRARDPNDFDPGQLPSVLPEEAAPTIASFTVTPDHVAPGEPAVLKWTVKNATAVHLDPPGGGVSLQAVGHKNVNPTATATYTLTATAGGKTVTQQVVVIVAATKPAVHIAFYSDKPSIKPGESATLKWSVTGAQSVSIDNGIGAVKNADGRKVTPTDTTTYRLTATEPSGARVTQAVTILVYTKPN